MVILMRRLSPYTEDDLLLGVFVTSEEAKRARRRYVAEVLRSGRDPHAKQAYHEVGEGDVRVLSRVREIDLSPGQPRVFVVSSYAEGFGQRVRRFEAICGTERGAQAFAEAFARKKTDGPSWCAVDAVEAGRLLAGVGPQ